MRLLTATLLSVATLASGGQPMQTFATAGARATSTLLDVWYAGGGFWRTCNAADCATGNRDWGLDSLTYTLALRYRASHDRSLLAPLRALEQTSPSYPAPCTDAPACASWSDVPMWDAIALLDEYGITGDAVALGKAEAAFAFVDRSGVYALGACPRIPYQQPGGGGNDLKTLETEANYVKAALLLYDATHDRSYLAAAENGYDAARAYFLDPAVPLYTVWVFDDGTGCVQVPHRFFASVNGDMIWSGLRLYRDTGMRAYLDEAIATAHAAARDLGDPRGIFADLQAENGYDAARAYFLDPAVPLYTVWVFDDGTDCVQVPHRFFASVNGDMIWSGLRLYRDTGTRAYLDQAIATAHAAARDLGDPRGIFADLQAENDVVEPLVEGMDALATDGQAFARAWILRNAAAALSARSPDGSFGRFFDGPPPVTTDTAWQTNGGLALEIAAAALAPRSTAEAASAWARARKVPDAISALPASITFHGSAIALYGTLGQECCEAGHARVFVDGRETFDGTGIWQNKSSSGRTIPNTLLFAWRWPRAGTHTVSFEPGTANGKEGGPFLALTVYEVLR